jgi:hypothetical protein
MKSKAADKKLIQILADLRASDDKLVAHAIKSLELHGTSEAIRPIVDRLSQPLSEKNRSDLFELLCSVKDSSSRVEIMDLLADDGYAERRTELLTAIWNMKVDFSDYVSEFVELAVTGDFLQTLECLTIIENMEGPFLEEDILESQLHLKSYLESDQPKDDQKAHLLSEIAIRIKEINETLTD